MISSKTTTNVFLGSMIIVTASNAQTVQLPVFRQFYTTGSVSVPDRGNASLGGVNRYRGHQASVGLPLTGGLQNRSFSSGAGSANASMTATIIDLDEMDKQVLGSARPNETKVETEIERRAAYITRNIARFEPVKVHSLERNDSRSSKANRLEFERLLEHGDAAYKNGKPRVARNFYRVALKMAASEDRQSVLERMEKMR